MMKQQQQFFDENLYSRQVAVHGEGTQATLTKMNFFIFGLRGLGAEIAKNLVLAGPKSITIYDNNLVHYTDLGSNFYTKQEQIGKITRAEATISELKELNPYVTVSIFNEELTPEILSNFKVVILADCWDKEFIIQVNNAVRSKGNGFILTHSSGLFGSTFVDFSDKFTINDLTGEEPKQAIIAGITNDVCGLVKTIDDRRHGLSDGDYVIFKEVLGMKEVNDQVFRITVKSPYMFSIGDTSKYSQYQREGLAIQVKVPIQVEFKSFSASLSHPIAPGRNQLELMDREKIGRPEQLHISYYALLEYFQNTQDLPRINNEEDAQKLWELVQQLNDSNRGEGTLKTDLDEEIVKNIARHVRTQITATTSFWGGIVAQEVIKFTGKFSPIRQWLHADFFECLPEGEVNRQLQNKQYDDYIAIFGQEILQKLQNAKVFIVGAGALGCEYIKMYALMGMGSGSLGLITVTDDDIIKISNLNRQFLYRKHDVGTKKATVACGVGRKMNFCCKLKETVLRIGKQNEEIFNDNFWESLDIVVNTVDNVNARRYIEEQCCYYCKPLFESGTLGTKCNSQMILPGQTQSYCEPQDHTSEEQTPFKTQKAFPFLIEHTIQWAKSYFHKVFTNGSIEYINYIENPVDYIKRTIVELKEQPQILITRLEAIKQYANLAKRPDHSQLVVLGRNMFQDIFCNQIKQLLYYFPPEYRTKEGELFWTNPKRQPVPIKFDENDEIHLQFIQSTVNIFAAIFNLKKIDNANEIKNKLKIQLKNIKVEKYQDDNRKITLLAEELMKQTIHDKPGQFKECTFEIDDQKNWHIEFLASVSNLRARNYKIKEVTAFQVKLISGDILPQIVTTTAMIVGAVGLEIFKYFQKKPIKKMKNAFINLALPLFFFSEPLPPQKHNNQEFDSIVMGPTQAIPPNWTAWDSIYIHEPMTLGQFIEYFQTKYDVDVQFIAVETYCLFVSYSRLQQANFDIDIGQLFIQKTKQPLPQNRKFIVLQVVGDIIVDGVERNADVAPVKYYFRK